MALIALHSVKDFFRIWFTWKIQALYVFFTIIFIVMAFSYLYTPDYVSHAKILLLPKTTEGVVVSTGVEDTRISQVSMADLNTEIELLTSDEVIKDTIRFFSQKGGMGLKVVSTSWSDKVVDSVKKAINDVLVFLALKDRLSPFDANVKLLKGALEVEPVANSNIILVSITAERPKAAAVVLNKLLEIYVSHHNRAFSKEEGIEFYEEQALNYRKRLDASEAKLKEYQSKWNIIYISRQQEANIEMLADLSKELKNIELTIGELKSRVTLLRKALKENKEDILIIKEMRTIPSIMELEKSVAPLLLERSNILSNYTESSKEYQNIEIKIKMIRDTLRKEITKAIAADEMELGVLKDKEAALRNKIKTLQNETNSLNQRERVLKGMEREVELLQKDYMLYASKKEDARIYGEKTKQDLSNISIAESANIPVEPDFPKRMLMLVVSIIVGIFAAMGIPFILEFLDRTFKIPEDVQHLLSLPVVCTFNEIKDVLKLK